MIESKDELKARERYYIERLDCINKNSSSLRFYNPLLDDHLNSFFANTTIRKHLKNNCFIDTNGFILYDSVYRSSIGASPKRKGAQNYIDKEKQLIYAIKQNNLVV